jgi:hypothetical protein
MFYMIFCSIIIHLIGVRVKDDKSSDQKINLALKDQIVPKVR